MAALALLSTVRPWSDEESGVSVAATGTTTTPDATTFAISAMPYYEVPELGSEFYEEPAPRLDRKQKKKIFGPSDAPRPVPPPVACPIILPATKRDPAQSPEAAQAALDAAAAKRLRKQLKRNPTT